MTLQILNQTVRGQDGEEKTKTQEVALKKKKVDWSNMEDRGTFSWLHGEIDKASHWGLPRPGWF